MEFTGERFLPTLSGEIRHEHLHRYAWCRRLVEGKVVLDIACGEGYGSAMLARSAASVTGVDISVEAVQHATEAYAHVARLQYKQGDAAAIPLPDSSVDVVVSFETIEHHDRHNEMISEIRRVLRPDGLLIISSPNRIVYTELAGHHNEYHVKELDFDEFDAVLKQQFDQVRYFGHRLAVGSSIFTLQGDNGGRTVDALTDTGSEVVERAASLANPVYFIAVAGAIDAHSVAQLRPSILYSEAEDLYTHHREVALWATRIDSELHALRDTYGSLVKEHAETAGRAVRLDETLRDTLKDRNRLQLQAGELAELREQYERILHSQSWRLTRPLRALSRLLRGDLRSFRNAADQWRLRATPISARRLSPSEVIAGLTFESCVDPLVTIIIPVYGNLAITAACLRSIATHPPAVPYEILVAEDASGDTEIDALAHVPGLRFVSNSEN
ncbi:MAG: methyltransferase domain-containing protein, partial [Rhodanobacter sp.]